MIVKKNLEEIFTQAFICLNYDVQDIDIRFSAMSDMADFQCNSAFKIAKKVGKKPMEVAQDIYNALHQNDMYEYSVSAPAYINIKLTNKGFSYFANEMDTDKILCVEQTKEPKKIIMDYGGANIAKELHMGHLRSPIIGESIKRLLRLKGNTVLSDMHWGDFGLQMGLTVAQLEEDGYLDYYFKNSGDEPKITLDLLNEEYPKASGRKHDETFKAKADDYTLKIQQHIEPYFSAYTLIKQVSMNECLKNYKMLNIDFDYLYGESDTAPYIDNVVQMFVDKGLAYESGGALVCDVAEEGEHIPIPKKNENDPQLYKNPMPPVLLKKYNGGDLYATTDIATIYMRNEMDNPDEIIYVTDARQKQHFIQVFRACKKCGISPENQKLLNIGFGTINGKDGKPFKTRSGETIKLKDVVNMVTDKANEKIQQNGLKEDKELARQIGVAALKFGDLINTISKDYILDIDKFLAFEGKTGPYIQYNCARINSILNKANIQIGKIDVQTPEEKDVLMHIFKLLDSYDICINDMSLNALCTALFDLANSFSVLYNNIHILSEQNQQRQAGLLGLCKLTLKALSQGLNMLAIDVPEKM